MIENALPHTLGGKALHLCICVAIPLSLQRRGRPSWQSARTASYGRGEAGWRADVRDPAAQTKTYPLLAGENTLVFSNISLLHLHCFKGFILIDAFL